MGATYVDVTIRNPAERHRCWEGNFLVDTGATDSQVPRRHLEAIGIEPRAGRDYELADGRVSRLDVSSAELEFEGEFAAVTVIFGEDESEPLLGLTALESTGFGVDPVDGKLRRTRRLRR